MPSLPMKPMQRSSSTVSSRLVASPTLSDGFTALCRWPGSWRLIPGALDRLLHVGDFRLRRVVAHGGAAFGQRHIDLLHAVDAREHAGHALHATFAVHAFDFQFDGFHR